ncbi:MAG: aryl-sulfate sulfotransferase [Bacteroidetes bacterium]|nr:aryl-sulfate sulfotransferase [Bacteroidota bacterium]MBS1630382.1 aryl-sulfate sulfotransferase [Bacteroidota bacterium]
MKSIFTIAFCFLAGPILAQQTVGLFSRLPASEDGYVLLAPNLSKKTYLIDKCGREINEWTSAYTPGFSAYLLEDGTLLRTGYLANSLFTYAGSGGLIQRFDWNNNLLWSLNISSTTECQHHDICYLPNGNILAIVWELKTVAQAIAAGRDSSLAGSDMWPDKIVEYQPVGTNSANIVWEWHAWDHLVQDRDSTKRNYGKIADNPGKLDINHISGSPANPDWLHLNSVAYNAQLDQIILSSFYFNEIWIIDHSTTTLQARGTTGGQSGRGGEILYRWGNPEAYGRGTVADRKFFESHDAHWIPQGFQDAGKIMVFNNGKGRPEGNYSSVEVIAPDMDENGNYILNQNLPYGPISPSWDYSAAPNKLSFFSPVMAGAERLPNGNTLICEATEGNLFEVTPNGSTVWKYVNPIAISGPLKQGDRADQNMVFRIRQYPIGYKGLKGKSLVPRAPLELNPIPNNCTSGSPTSVSIQQQDGQELRVANPFTQSIELEALSNLNSGTATLLNMLGQPCGQWSLNLKAGQRTSLPLQHLLPAGAYLLQWTNGPSRTQIKLVHE